jgi:hypothetical protein
MRGALVALVACLALVGCGSSGAGGTPAGGPPQVDAKVDLDRTIEDLDGTDVHLTGVHTPQSIPGVKVPDGQEWVVIDMTVKSEQKVVGSALRSKMSIVGGNGDSPVNADAEKALPNGLEKATVPKGKPTKASVVFAVDRTRVKKAQFSFAGETVPLGL